MKDIFSESVLHGPRLPELRQQLVGTPMDGGDSLKRGPIDQPHLGIRGVNAVRLDLAALHPPLETLKIEPGRRRPAAQDRAPLAMDNLFVRVLAVYLVVD